MAAAADLTAPLDMAPPEDVARVLPYPAFLPSVPVVVNSGGPVMASVNVVPVFFPGETLEAPVLDFLGKFMASSAFHAMTAEYGVGAGAVGPAVHIPAVPDAQIDDRQIRAWLVSQLDGTHVEWGAVDPEAFPRTLYIMFYPPPTAITYPGGSSCRDFSGYHSAAAHAVAHGDGGPVLPPVVYAVIPRCAGFDMNDLSLILSHEIVEAASDPLLTIAPAYYYVDEDHAFWSFTFYGGEIGDMCQRFEAQPPYSLSVSQCGLVPPDVGYPIQRSWSNRSSLEHHDPCVPVPPTNTPYFNAAAVLTENVSGFINGNHYTSSGVNIAVGQSRTVDVLLYSDGPTSGDWTVAAYDVLEQRGLGARLAFSFDRSTGHNGDTLKLTITAVAPSGFGGAPFLLVSENKGVVNQWVGLVGIP